MKKLLTVVAIVALSVGIGKAQNPIPAGTVFINAAAGFSNHGFPVIAGVDFGVGSDISAGAEAAYRFNYDGRWSIGANANYHFNRLLKMSSKFDFYAGINVGSTFGDHYDTSFNLGAQVGGRIFITDAIGLNLQLGGGNNFSGGRFGLTFRL